MVEFRNAKMSKDFIFTVDGLVIDSQLPKQVRTKYYGLCFSQNAFLHENLQKGLNRKLVAGVISETIEIVDAMRACKITTSRDDFEKWDSLAAFERLGMNVGFLRARLHRLMSLAFESEEACLERSQAEGEIRTLEAKLADSKENFNRLDIQIKRHEEKFKEENYFLW